MIRANVNKIWGKLYCNPPFFDYVYILIYIIYLFYFISIFILLTRRKATEALIGRVDNYSDLLPEMPRYCYPFFYCGSFSITFNYGCSRFSIEHFSSRSPSFQIFCKPGAKCFVEHVF